MTEDVSFTASAYPTDCPGRQHQDEDGFLGGPTLAPSHHRQWSLPTPAATDAGRCRVTAMNGQRDTATLLSPNQRVADLPL